MTSFWRVASLGVSRLIQDPSSKNIWTELGQGLANAPVTDLHYYTGSNLLLAGTFGRGAWTANETRDDLGKHSILRIDGTGDRDVVEISRVAGSAVAGQRPGGRRSAASISAVHARADRVRWEGRRRSAPPSSRQTDWSAWRTASISSAAAVTTRSGWRARQYPADRQATRRHERQRIRHLGDQEGHARCRRDPGHHLRDDGGAQQSAGENQEAERLSVLGRGAVARCRCPVGQAGSADLARQESCRRWARVSPARCRAAGLGFLLASRISGLKLGPSVRRRRRKARRRAAAHLSWNVSFETGLGALSLGEIGEDGQFSTPDLLRNALDALDATRRTTSRSGSSVSITPSEDDDALLFDGRDQQRASRDRRSWVSAADVLGGTVDLDGSIDISADLTLHVGLGGRRAGLLSSAVGRLRRRRSRSITSAPTATTRAEGQLGFLGVTLTDGELTMDPAVKIAVKLSDPGTDAADGKIRLTELDADAREARHHDGDRQSDGRRRNAERRSPRRARSVRRRNRRSTSAMHRSRCGGRTSPIPPAWRSMQRAARRRSFSASSSVRRATCWMGSRLVATTLQQVAGTDVLATKLLIVNKSLKDVLDGVGAPVVFNNDSVSLIFPLQSDAQSSAFRRVPGEQGPVRTRDRVGRHGALHRFERREAEHDRIGRHLPVHRQDRRVAGRRALSTSAFRIVRSGSLRHEIDAFLQGLEQPLSLHGRVPTLQELIEELANRAGIDIDALHFHLTGSGQDLAAELTIPFNPDPIQFTEHLDLGTTVAGLAFDGTGDINLAVDPQFRIPIGIRLHPDVPVGQRFFVVEDSDPEVTLNASAAIDNPDITGKVADVFQVRLQEDATVAPNQGIALTSTVHVNLVDPTTGPQADGRITLDEFSPSALSNMFRADIEGALDIDGLTLAAD